MYENVFKQSTVCSSPLVVVVYDSIFIYVCCFQMNFPSRYFFASNINLRAQERRKS